MRRVLGLPLLPLFCFGVLLLVEVLIVRTCVGESIGDYPTEFDGSCPSLQVPLLQIPFLQVSRSVLRRADRVGTDRLVIVRPRCSRLRSLDLGWGLCPCPVIRPSLRERLPERERGD